MILQQIDGSKGSSSVQSSSLLPLQTLPEDEASSKQDTSKVAHSTVIGKNLPKRSDKDAAASTKLGSSHTSSFGRAGSVRWSRIEEIGKAKVNLW